MNDYRSLRTNDLAHLWHPFTRVAALQQADFPIIEHAEGVYLHDVRGKAYLDGISSWWCVNLGHKPARVMAAIRAQLDALDQSILGGMGHVNAIRLAERLASIAPAGLTRTLFASDGASAVEAALKIALQYHAQTGAPERTRFVALTDAYHGDTLGALGVGFVEQFHKAFTPVVRPALKAQAPHCFHCPCGTRPEVCDTECFASMARVVEAEHARIAAVIVEPMCQGAAGMRIYPAAYLRKLRALCDAFKILLIADEIAVGFGRTGKLFACEHANSAPDIMCLGKALTGGVLPLSATLVTERIYAAFHDDGAADGTFYHGHTTCGSPITAAAALAVCDTFAEDHVLERAAPAMEMLRRGFERLAHRADVHRTATLGMASSLEIKEEAGGPTRARQCARAALERGLLIRPLGNVLYLWPPLTTSCAEMDLMLERFAAAIDS